MRPAWLVLMLASSVLGTSPGCAGSVPVEPTEASLELGTGTARFLPIEDGTELPMIKGAQGGWHLWVSVRASDLSSGVGSLTIEHQPADESEPPQTFRIGVMFDPPDAGGRRTSLGWTAILPNPSCSVGRLHRIRVTVTTATGERVSAEREVMPTAGDYPPPPCE
jgi:hypothetical protein